MRVARAGTAALCILLGVLPGIQFAVLPIANPDYAPYAFAPLASAAVVLGLAAAFFFTVGRHVLAPHETRLRDADAAYEAAGRGVTAYAHGLVPVLEAVYDGFVRSVAGGGPGGRRVP